MSNNLTNLQSELLKLYSLDLSDKDLLEVQRILAKFLADKAADEFDKLWDEKKWTDQTMSTWLEEVE